jgi:hypothetical protein
MFNYKEFSTRNIGFVTETEQNILKNATVFVPGVGGMGGVVVACLARVGIENFIISDIDYFELSNLNRQIFSNMEVLQQNKVDVTERELKKINPNIKIEKLGNDWPEKLPGIFQKVSLVINGCDDVAATITLMRMAKIFDITVIDAFASPLPNVYVVKPSDDRPEEAFNYPTRGKELSEITSDMLAQCVIKEIEHVMVNSSSAEYVNMDIAKEVMTGKRKRVSFAPMVWMTGILMSHEAVRQLLKKPGGPDVKGHFYNYWSAKVEKPKTGLTKIIRGFFVRRFLSKL